MTDLRWIVDGLFVSTVALIWFMLGYQSLLFSWGTFTIVAPVMRRTSPPSFPTPNCRACQYWCLAIMKAA
jgi:hypothetical protein